jgi:peptide/nickel transport system ATP-binding protein
MADLVFENLTVRYPARGGRTQEGEDVVAVQGVSLEVSAGGALGIAGESGSGKTTLAMAALRLLPKRASMTGRVMIDGRDVLTLRPSELRALRWSEAAIVFQGAMHSLNPVRKVGQQIDEALRVHRKGLSASARATRIRQLFDEVDLPAAKISSYPHELSGGQRQRVMIAMALSCDPKIVIADEPTTALDVIVEAQVLSLLKHLVSERGCTLMMITHDLSVLASTCDQVAVMYQGRVVERGISADVMAAPRHDHTRALADAFPTIGDPSSRLRPVSHRADARRAAGEEGPAAPQQNPPLDATEVVLSAEDVSVTFRGRRGPVPAVRNVSLDCHAGEIVALVGQSGSGKTTLARAMLGLVAADRGRVLHRGEPIARTPKGLRPYRRQVQMILQDPTGALNPKHSVYEAVAEGIRIHRLPGDEREHVLAALNQAELNPPERYAAALPSQLSGGERQRVIIAGALALSPEYLIADEPVASLDASVRGEILTLMLRLKREMGLGALIITHDLGVAWNIADSVAVMCEGRIVERGPVDQVLLSPRHPYTIKLLSVVPSLGVQPAPPAALPRDAGVS